MTPARAVSTCANAASVPPPRVVGSRRASHRPRCGRPPFVPLGGVLRFGHPPRPVVFSARDPPPRAPQLGAGPPPRLGREQESQRRPDHHAEQKRPEARALLAHSPASRSSGAATATGRGCACDWSGGRTKRSVTARVLVTRSCSNRKANVFSRSAAMAARTSAGKSHRRRLNGPIAFLRLL